MLRWDFPKHQLILKRTGPNGSPDSIIVFDQQGNKATEAECISAFQEFLKNDSGPAGPTQWAMNYGQKVHNEIWQAATRLWGLPHLKPRPVLLLDIKAHWAEDDYALQEKGEGKVELSEQKEVNDALPPAAEAQLQGVQ
jgi:hypothetical protein